MLPVTGTYGWQCPCERYFHSVEKDFPHKVYGIRAIILTIYSFRGIVVGFISMKWIYIFLFTASSCWSHDVQETRTPKVQPWTWDILSVIHTRYHFDDFRVQKQFFTITFEYSFRFLQRLFSFWSNNSVPLLNCNPLVKFWTQSFVISSYRCPTHFQINCNLLLNLWIEGVTFCT